MSLLRACRYISGFRYPSRPLPAVPPFPSRKYWRPCAKPPGRSNGLEVYPERGSEPSVWSAGKPNWLGMPVKSVIVPPMAVGMLESVGAPHHKKLPSTNGLKSFTRSLPRVKAFEKTDPKSGKWIGSADGLAVKLPAIACKGSSRFICAPGCPDQMVSTVGMGTSGLLL